jgi:hypothetical protein
MKVAKTFGMFRDCPTPETLGEFRYQSIPTSGFSTAARLTVPELHKAI